MPCPRPGPPACQRDLAAGICAQCGHPWLPPADHAQPDGAPAV